MFACPLCCPLCDLTRPVHVVHDLYMFTWFVPFLVEYNLSWDSAGDMNNPDIASPGPSPSGHTKILPETEGFPMPIQVFEVKI